MQAIQDVTHRWADWVITHVRVRNQGIASVLARKDLGNSLARVPDVFHRDILIALLRWHGTRLCTAFETGRHAITGAPLYSRGADIHVVMHGQSDYLRTDRNQIPDDNLGALPRF